MAASEWLQRLQQELHVWLVIPEQVNDPEKLAAYAELLSTEERERQQRFHFEKDRHSYLVSHALVRTVLSKYAPIDPADWQFSNGAQGRPELVTGAKVPPLRFNLSHTAGLAACVISETIACGVDVEKIVARDNLQAIAARMFAPAEIDALALLAGADYLEQFFTYWTLREAYYKALGTGIARSDNRHAFMKTVAQRYQLDVSLESGETMADDWYFEVNRPTPDHLLSVAFQSGQGDVHNIVINTAIP